MNVNVLNLDPSYSEKRMEEAEMKAFFHELYFNFGDWNEEVWWRLVKVSERWPRVSTARTLRSGVYTNTVQFLVALRSTQ